MILAFDPGVTTGWVRCEDNEFSSAPEYIVGQLGGSLTEVFEFLNDYRPGIVVYEEFKHRNQIIRAELYSVQVIGVIRLWCERNETIEVTKFLPGYTKSFWTNDKIKRLGLWAPGKPHAMDAMRVLLAYRAKSDKHWLHTMLQKLHTRTN